MMGRMAAPVMACRINSAWLMLQAESLSANSAYSSSVMRVLTTRLRCGVLYRFRMVKTSFRLPHGCGGISGVSRISRVWGRHSPTRFPQEQNERKANFGTAVESCSKKTAKLPLYSLLRREMQIWQSFEKLFDKTFRQSWKISAVFGAKKQETFSDFLSWYAAVTGGGYSVVIPRKQTCSPYLKRFLCKWACGCPALFFSAGCKSHLQRLTGSFHFPCSKRLQIFVSV